MTELRSQIELIDPAPGQTVVLWREPGEHCSQYAMRLAREYGVTVVLIDKPTFKITSLNYSTLDAHAAADVDGYCHTGDCERDRQAADGLLCDLLLQLGFPKTVAAYKAVKRCCA